MLQDFLRLHSLKDNAKKHVKKFWPDLPPRTCNLT